MRHSLCYRIYKRIQGIYENSTMVKWFSNFLSMLFLIFINSKIFTFFTKDNEKMLRDSILLKGLLKPIKVGSKIFGKMNRVSKMIHHSFFANFFTEILVKKDNQRIHDCYLLIVFSLLFNISIKMITGNFSLVANKKIILLMIFTIFLYIVRLDYQMILKESKMIKIMDKIINDEM